MLGKGVTFYMNCSFQTHPNIDKKLFSQESIIGLKQPNKPFPLNSEIGVLKWRLQSTDEALMPLSSKMLIILTYIINCCKPVSCLMN